MKSENKGLPQGRSSSSLAWRDVLRQLAHDEAPATQAAAKNALGAGQIAIDKLGSAARDSDCSYFFFLMCRVYAIDEPAGEIYEFCQEAALEVLECGDAQYALEVFRGKISDMADVSVPLEKLQLDLCEAQRKCNEVVLKYPKAAIAMGAVEDEEALKMISTSQKEFQQQIEELKSVMELPALPHEMPLKKFSLMRGLEPGTQFPPLPHEKLLKREHVLGDHPITPATATPAIIQHDIN